MTDHQSQYQNIQITKGPSREELFDALRLRHEGRKVSFTIRLLPRLPGSILVDPKEVLEVIVEGIAVKDVGGNSWLIQLRSIRRSTNGWLGFNGYYDSITRRGWLKVV